MGTDVAVDEPEIPAGAALGRARPARPTLGPRGPVGTHLRGGAHGNQIVRTSGHRWSDEAEEIFLDALALTCNAALAAAQAGFSPNAVYRRRRNDPRFAERWQTARQQGVARLDLLLIRGAEAALEGRDPDCESPLPPMTVADAIAIVKMYGEKPDGERRHRDWQARPRELEEVRASILRKLEAVERACAAAGGAGEGGGLSADTDGSE